ncbi:hypothetical protein H4R35_004890 [Dimargaris xerosporica]|nr:hypothetical protein H4R35_004890 [Dimargaris xerosporica]
MTVLPLEALPGPLDSGSDPDDTGPHSTVANAPKPRRQKHLQRLLRKRNNAYTSLAKVEAVHDAMNLFTAEPTPLLCLLNVGYGGVTGATTEQLEQLLARCPGFRQLVMTHGKPHTFIVFTDVAAAAHAQSTLHEQPCELFLNKPLFLEYVPLQHTPFTAPLKAHITHILQTTTGATTATGMPLTPYSMQVDFSTLPMVSTVMDQMAQRGLHVFSDFVTADEEQALLSHIAGQRSDAWVDVNGRWVQHYGHTFDYKHKQVGTAANTVSTTFPSIVTQILERSRSLAVFQQGMSSDSDKATCLVFPAFNQLTISQYPVGSGIAFHSDSHRSFTDVIFIISLQSPITMEFRSPYYPTTEPDARPTKTRASNPQSLASYSTVVNPVFIDLPPRSLTIMTGEVRYGWEHSIRARKSDLLFDSGGIRPRQTRASLTIRQVNPTRSCNCRWSQLCDHCHQP